MNRVQTIDCGNDALECWPNFTTEPISEGGTDGSQGGEKCFTATSK